MTHEMSTDSFINALRRFLAMRVIIRCIWSDDGTNFVGADNELRKYFAEIDETKVKSFLLEKNCDWIDWKRNPPHSSYMGTCN